MFRNYVRIIATSLSFMLIPFLECNFLLPIAKAEDMSRGKAWDERYGNGEVPGDYMGSWTVANVDSFVSLREYPDTQSNRVAKVPKWADVEAYYYDGNWFECYYNGLHGYILREYLTDRPGKYSDYPGNYENYYEEPQFSQYYPDQYIDGWQLDYIGEYYVVNCNEWVSLREHADESSTRLAKVPLGARVNSCYDTIFDFILCDYNGEMGFIKKQYLMDAASYERSQMVPEHLDDDIYVISTQLDKSSTEVAEMGDLFYMWNEYAELNLYGGDKAGEAYVDWREGYPLFDNFAGSFDNGVSMGILGNLFGDGIQDPKSWLLTVAPYENAGQDTILQYLVRNMVNVDAVEVTGSELHGWRLGTYEGGDMISEEEFYEFYVDMYSEGIQYDILIEMSSTYDEGDYIASTLITTDSIGSLRDYTNDVTDGDPFITFFDQQTSVSALFTNQSGLAWEQQADTSILSGKRAFMLCLNGTTFSTDFSDFLLQTLEMQYGMSVGGCYADYNNLDGINESIAEEIDKGTAIFIISTDKITPYIEEACSAVRAMGIKVINCGPIMENVDVNFVVPEAIVSISNIDNYEELSYYYAAVIASTIAGKLTSTNLYYESAS